VNAEVTDARVVVDVEDAELLGAGVVGHRGLRWVGRQEVYTSLS
jgi:hypothetical protein